MLTPISTGATCTSDARKWLETISDCKTTLLYHLNNWRHSLAYLLMQNAMLADNTDRVTSVEGQWQLSHSGSARRVFAFQPALKSTHVGVQLSFTAPWSYPCLKETSYSSCFCVTHNWWFEQDLHVEHDCCVTQQRWTEQDLHVEHDRCVKKQVWFFSLVFVQRDNDCIPEVLW